MLSLEDYYKEYSESHQNETNILIHQVCVPLILWSILGLASFVILGPFGFTLAHLFCLVLSSFYLYMGDWRIGLVLFFIQGLMIFTFQYIPSPKIVFSLVFVLSWVGQFIGHKIEGKRPSFFKDLFFLFIGPGWVLKKTLVHLQSSSRSP